MDKKHHELLSGVIAFYDEYKTEDGVHPGIGWVYCEQDKDQFDLSQIEFDGTLAALISEGYLMGRSESQKEGEPLAWHEIIPTDKGRAAL